MKYVEGDIFKLAEEGKFDYVIHGCNCQNAMGSGIAKTVRDKYPKAYAADMSTQKGDITKLGHFTTAYVYPIKDFPFEIVKHGFTIINAYTQEVYWAREDENGKILPNVDYDAIFRAFKGIKLMFDNNPGGVSRFAIPKIGAVRGGGDWDKIEEIIDSVGFVDLTCVIYNGDVNK